LLRIANVTAMTAAVPAAIMSQVGIPLMAELHATGDRVRLQRTVTALAQAQFAGVVLLSLPLFLFPGQLLSLAFGPGFADAAGALKLLLAGQILNAAFGPNIWLLNMTNHERRVLRALLIALAINAVAVPLLASRWGASGGAIALLGSMICWNIISWLDSKRLLDIETSIFSWPWRAAQTQA
jgi:O-antigen/teichoic acid export membrane protein